MQDLVSVVVVWGHTKAFFFFHLPHFFLFLLFHNVFDSFLVSVGRVSHGAAASTRRGIFVVNVPGIDWNGN